MKKLLLISSNSVHIYNFINLIKENFDELLLITDRENPNYHGTVKIVDFSLINPVALFKTSNAIQEIIKSFQPSIIHIHQANSVAWHTFHAIPKKNKIPVLLTAWGSDILVLPKKNWLLRKMVVYNLLRADELTSDSNYMAVQMKNLMNRPNKIIHIANFGIDIKPLNLPREKLVYSNRLHKPLYQIEKILFSFKKFISKPENKDWKLAIAGESEETKELKILAESLQLKSNVSFEGWVDKRKNSELYSRATFFVSIPESDATSISLLEAMACGCIPIVSKLPANEEWITSGLNGYVTNNLSADFFSPALSINQEEARKINFDLINKNATISINRDRFINLYQRLCSNQ